MTDDRTSSEERSALAAELALGVLEGPELARAREHAASDPRFREDVAQWSGSLAPLLDDIAPISPPASLWAQIQRATGTIGESSNVHVLRRKVAVWRSVSGVMTALAASLALFVMFRSPVPVPSQPPASTPMVARLADDKQVAVVASWDPQRGQLLLASAAGMPEQPARSHELWVIPAGGKPRSLGVMPKTEDALIRLPASAIELMRAGATIAVTVEPLGGSPTGGPTGPIIASGALKGA
jgi:anti-sigma-K factor RskA